MKARLVHWGEFWLGVLAENEIFTVELWQGVFSEVKMSSIATLNPEAPFCDFTHVVFIITPCFSLITWIKGESAVLCFEWTFSRRAKDIRGLIVWFKSCERMGLPWDWSNDLVPFPLHYSLLLFLCSLNTPTHTSHTYTHITHVHTHSFKHFSWLQSHTEFSPDPQRKQHYTACNEQCRFFLMASSLIRSVLIFRFSLVLDYFNLFPVFQPNSSIASRLFSVG